VGSQGPCVGQQFCNEIADQCEGTTLCPVAPVSCNTAAKSIIQIKDRLDDRRDQITWKMVNAAAATQADFGSPPSTTTHTVCIYSGAPGQLIYELALVPGSKWSALRDNGWKYRDGALTPFGVQKVIMKGDAIQARTKLMLKGKQENLPDLAPNTLPFGGPGDYPITVQLINDTTPVCWSSVFDAADVKKNTDEQFKALDR
jgi:hypothetical protein